MGCVKSRETVTASLEKPKRKVSGVLSAIKRADKRTPEEVGAGCSRTYRRWLCY
jgi:hypothetical protein